MEPSIESTTPCIFVDADACPVKLETVRVADRYGLQVVFVANQPMRLPAGDRVRLEQVGDAFDAADDWIAKQVRPGDLVITADIHLAARCLDAGAAVLGPSGDPFTDAGIGDALAMRDLLADLRSGGEITGGPPPLTDRDRSRFLQSLDRLVQAALRKMPDPGPE